MFSKRSPQFLSLFILLTALFGNAQSVLAEPDPCPVVVVRYSYNPLYPTRSGSVRDEVKIELPKLVGQQRAVSDQDEVKKTVFALKLIASFERAIDAFDRRVSWSFPEPIYRPMIDGLELPRFSQPYSTATPEVEDEDEVRGHSGLDNLVRPAVIRRPNPDSQNRNKVLAAALKAEFDAYKAFAQKDKAISDDAKLMGLIDLGFKLCSNIENWQPMRRSTLEGMRSFSATAVPKGLNVTAGGAQDAGHFRAAVAQGQVPDKEGFSADGLLRELDLSIPFQSNSLLAVRPSYLVDPTEGLLYIQLGMSSNVTPENFVRNPLNLTVALDISGSMGATDGTAHTRMEWAKASLKTALRKLKGDDTLSIILFDGNVDVFLEPSDVAKLDIAALENRIQAEIQTRGSTDVELAHKKALGFAQKQAMLTISRRDKTYENRILLLSDAGNTTGGTPEGIIRSVYDAGNQGIGTTVVGLGTNFRQELVDAFANAKGGNYLFVQNGEQMRGLFDNFGFLVQPVAEDFKAAIEVAGLPTTVERAWGVNARPGEQTSGMIAVPTLFFAGEGGGAMVVALRYANPQGPAMPGQPPTPVVPKPDDRTGPAMPQ